MRRNDRRVRNGIGGAVLALTCAGALLQARFGPKRGVFPARSRSATLRTSLRRADEGFVPRDDLAPERRALHGASALLALSVLADSALEHYRGSFENPGMLAPLLTSALAAVENARAASKPVEHSTHALAMNAMSMAIGLAGTGFHIANVWRRPGKLSWLNLFYAAPIGAPSALSLAGIIGIAADRLRRVRLATPAMLFRFRAGRALAALTSIALAGTVAEVALLHFRGAFQNPFMVVPVSVPPIAALAMGDIAMRGARGANATLARVTLGATALAGVAGVGFHAYGVSRAMGGFRNWSQNVVDGPPLPAPPSFTALALVGFAALALVSRERPRDAVATKLRHR